MKLRLLFPALLVCSSVVAQTQRIVLQEEFTNASCGPCASANPTYNSLLSTNTAKVVSIKYQTNWPGTDPMNAQNAPEVANRVSYYAVSGVPNVQQDGVNKGSPTAVTQSVIDNEYAVASPFTINLVHWLNTATDSMFINCEIVCKQNVNMTTPFVRIAMIEKVINFTSAPGSNGEKAFYTVMRKMYPDAKGTSAATAWTSGQKRTISFAVKIPSYIYKKSELAAVAWVQDDATKSVKQAALSSSPSAPLALPPIASFSSLTSSCDGLIQFQDNSGLFPTSWHWDFGDGTTSTLQSPFHRYSSSGNYTVTFDATNSYGTNQSLKPAYLTANLSGNAPTVVSAKRCGSGVVNLSATPSGSGTLNWYNASGTLVNTGNTYSPSITGITKFYVAEMTANAPQSVGPATNGIGAGAYFSANNVHGMYFDVLKPCTLVSVMVYADTAGNRTFQVLSPTGSVIKSVVFNCSNGANVVTFNTALASGSGYFIKVSSTFVDLYRNSAGPVYPYTNGVVSITGNDAGAAYYYFFYDWKTQLNPCASPSALATGTDSCSTIGITEQPGVHSLSVFPNPGNGVFNLSFEAIVQDRYVVRVSNAIGQVVYEETMPEFRGSYSNQIPITSAGAGVYMLSIINSTSATVRKLVVQ